MSHNTHTHIHTHTARRGGNNPLQRARRMQGALVPWIGLAFCVLFGSLLWSVYADLGCGKRMALRIVLAVSAICAAALLRRMIRLEGQISTLHAEQRAASRAAAQRRSIR